MRNNDYKPLPPLHTGVLVPITGVQYRSKPTTGAKAIGCTQTSTLSKRRAMQQALNGVPPMDARRFRADGLGAPAPGVAVSLRASAAHASVLFMTAPTLPGRVPRATEFLQLHMREEHLTLASTDSIVTAIIEGTAPPTIFNTALQSLQFGRSNTIVACIWACAPRGSPLMSWIGTTKRFI